MTTNFYLKLESPSVRGESTAPQHQDEIEVLSWSHAFSQPTSPTRSSAGGGTVEQANHSEFSFAKYIDAATDGLLRMCWSGRTIAKGTFSAYRAGGDKPVKYLTIEFKNIIVSNYSVSGGAGDLPTETVTLSYAAVTYTYIPAKPDDGSVGGHSATHDLMRQTVS